MGFNRFPGLFQGLPWGYMRARESWRALTAQAGWPCRMGPYGDPWGLASLDMPGRPAVPATRDPERRG